MPDPTPDLVALADQVKFLSGDLSRRFEILSGELSKSVNQLNTRMDTLSTSRKVEFPFKPALGGDWLDGTTSPLLTLETNVEAVGLMDVSVVLPNLSRIGVFRASVRTSDAVLSAEATLNITLNREDIGGKQGDTVVALSFPLVPGIADQQGDPIAGMEFVDNDRFKYSVEAVLLITRPNVPEPPGVPPPDITLQPGMVVLESFQVDCVVA
jgi:hypothetical protein